MRKILLSVILIAAMALGAGRGIMALFSDTETATGNEATTGGSPDMLIEDTLPLGEGTQQNWVLENMAPGDGVVEKHTLFLINKGDSDASTLDIYIGGEGTSDPTHITVITETDPGFEAVPSNNEESDTLDGAGGMSRYMEITLLKYQGVAEGDLLKSYNLLYHTGADDPDANDDDPATPWDEVDDRNGNGFIDLNDFYSNPLQGLWPVPPAGGVSGDGNFQFRMWLTFDGSAGNDYQGDTVSFNIAGTLHD